MFLPFRCNFALMKRISAIFSLLFGCLSAFAQDIQTLRSSLMQYQFNALPLNPAYAGRMDATTFDAFYYGNFSSGQQLSRSAMVSLHGRGGAERQLGWGGVMQFYSQNAFNELNIHPTFSRILPMGNGNLSMGATLGISYFDVNEAIQATLNNSFMAVDGGLGVFWHNQRSFIGLSAPSVFETPIQKQDPGNGGILRSRSYNLHTGSLFRLNDELYLKPALLLRRALVYQLPEDDAVTDYNLWSADVHASVFIEGNYLIGLMAGYSKPADGFFEQTRLGVSATLLFNNFRLGYAVQYNNQRNIAVSLPATHTLSVGYDFTEDPEAGRRVF